MPFEKVVEGVLEVTELLTEWKGERMTLEESQEVIPLLEDMIGHIEEQ